MNSNVLKCVTMKLGRLILCFCLMAALPLAEAGLLLAQEQSPAVNSSQNGLAVSVEDLPSDLAPQQQVVGKDSPASTPIQGLSSSDTLNIDAGAGNALSSLTSMTMIKNFFIFIVILLVLYLVLKGLGKVSRFRSSKGQGIDFRMRGIMPLDNRKYLAAVEVDGRLLVVGVSQDRISKLAQWPLGSPAGFGENHSDFQEELTQPADLADNHELDISIVDDEEK